MSKIKSSRSIPNLMTIYGTKSKVVAATIRDIYDAMAVGDVQKAAGLCGELLSSGVDNPHPYLVLGQIALSMRDGAAANQWYVEAMHSSKATNNLRLMNVVHSGLGKAAVLKADPFTAVDHFEKALILGDADVTLVALFGDLMRQMGRIKPAAEILELGYAKNPTVSTILAAGEMYLAGDFFPEAARCFHKATSKNMNTTPHLKKARLQALFLTMQYEAAATYAELLLRTPSKVEPYVDDIAIIYMTTLRQLGRRDELDTFRDNHEFTDIAKLRTSMAIMSNAAQDVGDNEQARALYQMSWDMLDVSREDVEKAYGSFLFRQREFQAGAELFASRQPEANRRQVPYENSSRENLAGHKEIILVGEQGIGDQLALFGVGVSILKRFGVEKIELMSEPRVAQLLERNSLGVVVREDIRDLGFSTSENSLVFMGDLIRHIDGTEKGAGYLQFAKGERHPAAAGRPLIGVSWKSEGTMSGALRSVPLADILAQLPANAAIMNLQYGDTAQEWKNAKKAFPAMVFIDPTVDHLKDLNFVPALLQSCDHVVTIDNTLAHLIGALGYEYGHMLLPFGSELMWYWSEEAGDTDHWYGLLATHKQTEFRDWSPALASLNTAFAGM
jgi:tetratricopeptide (TPR) repeat protein